MIKAVLFDCFGVLYPDTYWTIVKRHAQHFTEQKHTFRDLLRQADLGMLTREELWEDAAALLEMPVATLRSVQADLDCLDPHLLELIRTLRADGLKIGMISNIGEGYIDSIFSKVDRFAYFDDFVLSSEVGLIKPDHKIYELAAERLHVAPSECIFIDDIARNAHAAEDVGMHGIVYEATMDLQEVIATIRRQST